MSGGGRCCNGSALSSLLSSLGRIRRRRLRRSSRESDRREFDRVVSHRKAEVHFLKCRLSLSNLQSKDELKTDLDRWNIKSSPLLSLQKVIIIILAFLPFPLLLNNTCCTVHTKRKGRGKREPGQNGDSKETLPLPSSIPQGTSVSLPLFPLLLPSPYIIPGHMQNRREKADGAEITNAQRMDGRGKSFVPSAATFLINIPFPSHIGNGFCGSLPPSFDSEKEILPDAEEEKKEGRRKVPIFSSSFLRGRDGNGFAVRA